MTLMITLLAVVACLLGLYYWLTQSLYEVSSVENTHIWLSHSKKGLFKVKIEQTAATLTDMATPATEYIGRQGELHYDLINPEHISAFDDNQICTLSVPAGVKLTKSYTVSTIGGKQWLRLYFRLDRSMVVAMVPLPR